MSLQPEKWSCLCSRTEATKRGNKYWWRTINDAPKSKARSRERHWQGKDLAGELNIRRMGEQMRGSLL